MLHVEERRRGGAAREEAAWGAESRGSGVPDLTRKMASHSGVESHVGSVRGRRAVAFQGEVAAGMLDKGRGQRHPRMVAAEQEGMAQLRG